MQVGEYRLEGNAHQAGRSTDSILLSISILYSQPNTSKCIQIHATKEFLRSVTGDVASVDYGAVGGQCAP